MLNEGLLNGVEGRHHISWQVVAFAFPITDRSRMTSSCAGKLGLCQPSQHAARPNLASRNNFTHGQTYISILHTPPSERPGHASELSCSARDGSYCGGSRFSGPDPSSVSFEQLAFLG